MHYLKTQKRWDRLILVKFEIKQVLSHHHAQMFEFIEYVYRYFYQTAFCNFDYSLWLKTINISHNISYQRLKITIHFEKALKVKKIINNFFFTISMKFIESVSEWLHTSPLPNWFAEVVLSAPCCSSLRCQK